MAVESCTGFMQLLSSKLVQTSYGLYTVYVCLEARSHLEVSGQLGYSQIEDAWVSN